MRVLTPAEARQLWPELESAILQALSRFSEPGPMFWLEVQRGIFNGNAHVLISDLFTPFCIGVAYIDGDVCNLIAYNGTLRAIKLLKDEFVELARAAGCRTIRITGDEAWMRVVPGLRKRAVVMELAI